MDHTKVGSENGPLKSLKILLINRFLEYVNGARLLFFSLVSFNKNKNKTQQTKQQTKQKMSLSKQMEQACRDGKHEVVKKILSSHPESINFSDEVGNFFFFIILHPNISMIFVDLYNDYSL